MRASFREILWRTSEIVSTADQSLLAYSIKNLSTRCSMSDSDGVSVDELWSLSSGGRDDGSLGLLARKNDYLHMAEVNENIMGKAKSWISGRYKRDANGTFAETGKIIFHEDPNFAAKVVCICFGIGVGIVFVACLFFWCCDEKVEDKVARRRRAIKIAEEKAASLVVEPPLEATWEEDKSGKKRLLSYGSPAKSSSLRKKRQNQNQNRKPDGIDGNERRKSKNSRGKRRSSSRSKQKVSCQKQRLPEKTEKSDALTESAREVIPVKEKRRSHKWITDDIVFLMDDLRKVKSCNPDS
ncbi:hypothetical protein HELRODRAFT_172624 [Helobdella robusta]|uniref:Uncharacterized protein n=1 Tax=Helobdella robusta TaxID=6412 RepID=T1F5N5_HELRO|nr:hypothetical protein HELRODRAFT_172624 [Helobdella robusta]ESO04267.1 hypothetical protein HELRODRAFT_172624 [Helobdella robusta]